MYEGTLYGHWQAIVTLQQMLVLCDSAGVIDMTPQAISARTSIPLEIITKGIEVLSAPDPYSRTPGDDGKRISTIDEHRPWGWYIVNHAKYQKLKSIEEKREADRVRIAEKRNAGKNKDVAYSRKLSQSVASVADVAHADADADKRKRKLKEKPAQAPEPFVLPDWVPRKEWDGWMEIRKAKKAVQTAYALECAVSDLDKLRQAGQDPAAVLRKAIGGSWKSLYAVDGGSQNGGGERRAVV